jgi:hypothetical protein
LGIPPRLAIANTPEKRGKFLHPELYNMPETMGVNYRKEFKNIR